MVVPDRGAGDVGSDGRHGPNPHPRRDNQEHHHRHQAQWHQGPDIRDVLDAEPAWYSFEVGRDDVDGEPACVADIEAHEGTAPSTPMSPTSAIARRHDAVWPIRDRRGQGRGESVGLPREDRGDQERVPPRAPPAALRSAHGHPDPAEAQGQRQRIDPVERTARSDTGGNASRTRPPAARRSGCRKRGQDEGDEHRRGHHAERRQHAPVPERGSPEPAEQGSAPRSTATE